MVAMLPALLLMACSAPGARREAAPPPAPPAPDEQPAAPAPRAVSGEPPQQGSGAEAETARPEAMAEHDLLRFGQGFVALSREAQRQVFAQAEALYGRDRDPPNLVRYALLAALMGGERPAGSNRLRADLRAYLEADPGAASERELAPLASLLLRVLDEREQLTAQFAAQNDLLQKKLDELKAIERQLLERNDPANRATTP
jgi:hypothetical protein